MDLTMMEGVGDIGKNGRILFDRPKPTAGCSASGRRRKKNIVLHIKIELSQKRLP
jgi:hypothetical protein